MADEKDTAEAPAPKKKAPAKKSAPKASGFVVAEGKAISSGGRVFGPGETITADDVADLEALVKGELVVKA